ncbi:Methyltransferase pytC [Cladobotryum mycophilum]|uniref:Methyltransferase pytC n=1 Tax=Cladobotryum mycophilum TaxID=491253 RepID=A0ABR0SC96_9HYPO
MPDEGPRSGDGDTKTKTTMAEALDNRGNVKQDSTKDAREGNSEPTPPGDDEGLEAEEDFPDVDSALGADDASLTTSLRSSILQHRMENGRTYHAYLESIGYVLPNDGSEQDRLDLQHHLFRLTLGKLFICPAGHYKPIQRILDAGTGTGVWAMDIADEHPETEVTGVDLSPIQPSFVPPNVSFIIDNLEDEWEYPAKFDFVFGRMLTGSISDWPRFIEQSYNNLESGGWFELQDISMRPECQDGTLVKDSYIHKWSDAMLEAAARLGRHADSAVLYRQQMVDAGFINVTEVVYKWPTNQWPADDHYKELGFWCLHNVAGELSGLSMALFTRSLGWTVEQVEVFLTSVRAEMKDRRIHAWWPIHVVYGQKP